MAIHQPGARIAGRYEVAGRPLTGGMGIVYVCNDLEQDCPVALKTFKPEYLPDRAARDRFLREGTTWVDLGAHPHIVRCYRVLKLDVSDEVYLVLELITKEQEREDASLRAWLTPGHPLPEPTALIFALQIVRGMAHAVAVIPNLVHRDLKPENILVGADPLPNCAVNRLRVTDFGLASVLQEAVPHVNCSTGNVQYTVRDTQLTRGVVGTPLYMAPEQWRGEPTRVATDVYALGCILYEMVVGQRAIEGNTLEALQRAHCAGDCRSLPDGVTKEVHGIITHCMALEPKERYTSWEEVRETLVDAYESVAGQAAPPQVVAKRLNQEEKIAAGWSFNAMGNSYLDIGKAKVAVRYFERAVKVREAEGNQALAGAALGNGLEGAS